MAMAAPARATRGAVRTRSATTGRRLAASFAAILALFAAVLLVVLQALSQMAEAEREVVDFDRAQHAGQRVATLVREQYIHQAHTIIEGNRSHIDHYQAIARSTRAASEELSLLARTQREKELATEISRLVRQNHDDFLDVILPAVDRGAHEDVVRLHGEAELLVGGVASLVKELNGHFEAGSDAARKRADGQRRRVRSTVLGCFGAAAMLATLLAIWTTRWIAQRIGSLREGALTLGDGDLSRRIELSGDDEFTELARTVNVMAARLEKHRDELVQSQKLASIGRLCAGVAHEINGPLGVILGYASVIRKQGVDDEALGAIEQEAHQCQRIVQALLDMSRNEAPRFDPVDLVQLAHDGVERLRAIGVLGERDIRIVKPVGDVLAFGDEAKLRQVVLNLLRNAVDVTDEGGRIDVDLRTHGKRVRLVVMDRGPGIADVDKSRLFEPFFTTKKGGTGLGLAIARAIVEAHRGRILVDAREGGGTRVEVELEQARQDAVEAFL